MQMRAGSPNRQPSQVDFINTVFSKLDEYEVRYCVLHSWETLPERLESDLDIGVHPKDKAKLALALADVAAIGYTPVQSLNYFVNAHYTVFAWFHRDGSPHFAALDVIFEHRRGGLIVPSGEELVANRSREKNFWIPDPSVEFAYLLSKKTWKRSISPKQVGRLRWLVTCLGTAHAESIAQQLFARKLARKVLAAITAGTIGELIPNLKWQTWRTSLRRTPLKAMRLIAEDVWRRLQRWAHPTGLFVVFVGPDGVGKSTIISHVKQGISPSFRREKVFHWRPYVIWRRQKQTGPSGPHQHPSRTALNSSVASLLYFVDCWLGYILLIRPMLARSTLVIFDRYLYDMQIDPRRYRFGGPTWLARLLGRLAPRPDLLFVLDASERVILHRKDELSAQELRRQRTGYGRLAEQSRNTATISTGKSVESATNAVWSVMVGFLAERLRRRLPSLYSLRILVINGRQKRNSWLRRA